MHPRNRYRKQKELDLDHLASSHPPLLVRLVKEEDGKLRFDPKIPGAVDALVTAMIRVDFGVTTYEGVPKGNLVPSVTRSLNYIHFVEDLVVEAQAKGVDRDFIRRLQNKSKESSTRELPMISRNPLQERIDRDSDGRVARPRPRKRIELDFTEEDNNHPHGSKEHSSIVQEDGFLTNQEPKFITSDVDHDREASLDAAEAGRPQRIDGKHVVPLDETKVVKGVDVGVGASCVFPLLSCAIHSNWSFLGLDVDETSIEWARKNSLMFADRIEIRSSEKGPVPRIMRAINMTNEAFDFLMCNPPFFSRPDETYDQEEDRAFGGTDLERWCEGGEIGFVSGLIDESITLRNKIVWFTSMLGIKDSLNGILAKLYQSKPAPETIRVHRLEQGHKARWVVAWSFQESLAIHPVRGRVIHIDNLTAGETISDRIHQALSDLRGFTMDTGICGGSEGYRFRIQVIDLGGNRVRVDGLDLKAGRMETEDDIQRRAMSTIRKVEQGLERKSRRWKKTFRGSKPPSNI
jgi:23S rRNA A1618 N6-methylase RlmF